MLEDQNGQITQYTLIIVEMESQVTIQRSIPSNQTSLTLSSLLPFTSYDCMIAASTSVGLGPLSMLLQVTTLEDSEQYAWQKIPC